MLELRDKHAYQQAAGALTEKEAPSLPGFTAIQTVRRPRSNFPSTVIEYERQDPVGSKQR